MTVADRAVGPPSYTHPATPPVSASGERLHYIDGLRAIAIGLVMLHHFASGNFAAGLVARGARVLGTGLSVTTNSGVELFFVLSGVVLLRPYLRGTRPFDATRYAERRVARLWPPFLASWIFAGLVVVFDTLSPTWYDTLPRFSVADWVRQAGIVNLGWPTYNLAWWSLTAEVTFYVLAPFIVAGLRQRQQSIRPIVLTALLCWGASVIFWNDGASMPGVPSGLLNLARQFAAYSPCFLAGVLLARADLRGRVGWALMAAAVGYLSLSIMVARANVHVAFALLYSGVITVARVTPWIRRQLERPSMVWIGERSYSMFLTHFAVLYLADAIAAHVYPGRTRGYYISTRAGAAAGTFLASILLFWFVERRFARKLATGSAFWPWQAVAAMDRSEKATT